MDVKTKARMMELAALGRRRTQEDPEFAASARRAFAPSRNEALTEDERKSLPY